MVLSLTSCFGRYALATNSPWFWKYRFTLFTTDWISPKFNSLPLNSLIKLWSISIGTKSSSPINWNCFTKIFWSPSKTSVIFSFAITFSGIFSGIFWFFSKFYLFLNKSPGDGATATTETTLNVVLMRTIIKKIFNIFLITF